MKTPVTVYRCTCERCGFEWFPRTHVNAPASDPVSCPRCKSPYWNTPRKMAVIVDESLVVTPEIVEALKSLPPSKVKPVGGRGISKFLDTFTQADVDAVGQVGACKATLATPREHGRTEARKTVDQLKEATAAWKPPPSLQRANAERKKK